MSRHSWDRRIERAAELEKAYPAAAEALRFYQAIARFQKDLKTSSPEPELLLEHMPALLALIRKIGPPPLAQAAEELAGASAEWPNLLNDADLEPTKVFFARVLLQPYAARAALDTEIATDIATGVTRTTCPVCGERPVAAVLRPEGEGGKRNLICSLCFTEWEFRRMLCPNCGEEDYQKLPVYTAAEFQHIRVEACDACRHYIKAVDLTINGHAVPEVDELAAIALDVWAAERDYAKVMTNILGL
jgi:FdhE protein